MTPAELMEAREALGLKRSQFARLFQTTDRTVRAWENDGDTKWREIPFAVATLVRLALKLPAVRRELGIAILKAPRAKGEQTPAG